jgi:hypothetical protein
VWIEDCGEEPGTSPEGDEECGGAAGDTPYGMPSAPERLGIIADLCTGPLLITPDPGSYASDMVPATRANLHRVGHEAN